MKIYTLNYKLFAKRENEEKLIDEQILDWAYRSRENAFKAVQERIKTHIELCNYKPTRSQFVIESDTSETGTKYVIEYEIKEHYLSEFEKES